MLPNVQETKRKFQLSGGTYGETDSWKQVTAEPTRKVSWCESDLDIVKDDADSASAHRPEPAPLGIITSLYRRAQER